MESRNAAQTYEVIIDIGEETERRNCKITVVWRHLMHTCIHLAFSHTLNKHKLSASYQPITVLGVQDTKIENSVPTIKGL